VDAGTEQSGRQPLDNAPLPYGDEIEPRAGTTAGTSIIAAVSQKLNKGPKISVGESRRSGSESIFCGCPHGVGAVARGDGMMMAVDPVGGRGAMAGGGAARHTGAVVPRPVLIGRLGARRG
jgi:hypothetical protein